MARSPTHDDPSRSAATGLITTAGFADTLEIGRERKYELYDLNTAKPEPLVPRHLRLEVAERTTFDGRVKLRLDPREVRTLRADGRPSASRRA